MSEVRHEASTSHSSGEFDTTVSQAVSPELAAELEQIAAQNSASSQEMATVTPIETKRPVVTGEKPDEAAPELSAKDVEELILSWRNVLDEKREPDGSVAKDTITNVMQGMYEKGLVYDKAETDRKGRLHTHRAGIDAAADQFLQEVLSEFKVHDDERKARMIAAAESGDASNLESQAAEIPPAITDSLADSKEDAQKPKSTRRYGLSEAERIAWRKYNKGEIPSGLVINQDTAHESALAEENVRAAQEAAMATYEDNVVAGSEIDQDRAAARDTASHLQANMAEYWRGQGRSDIADHFAAEGKQRADVAQDAYEKELHASWDRKNSELAVDSKKANEFFGAVSESAVKQGGFNELEVDPRSGERTESVRKQVHDGFELAHTPISYRTRGSRLRGNRVVDVLYKSENPLFKDVVFVETRNVETQALIGLRAIAGSELTRPASKLSRWTGEVALSRAAERDLKLGLQQKPEKYRAPILDRIDDSGSAPELAVLRGMRQDGYDKYSQLPPALKKRKQSLIARWLGLRVG